MFTSRYSQTNCHGNRAVSSLLKVYISGCCTDYCRDLSECTSEWSHGWHRHLWHKWIGNISTAPPCKNKHHVNNVTEQIVRDIQPFMRRRRMFESNCITPLWQQWQLTPQYSHLHCRLGPLVTVTDIHRNAVFASHRNMARQDAANMILSCFVNSWDGCTETRQKLHCDRFSHDLLQHQVGKKVDCWKDSVSMAEKQMGSLHHKH